MATVKKAVSKKAPAVIPVRTGVDWKSLYLYAICLITLMVVLFSVISFINGILGIALPDPGYAVPNPTGVPNKQDAAILAAQASNEQLRAIRSMLKSLITFAVAAPLYLYHWRQTKLIN